MMILGGCAGLAQPLLGWAQVGLPKMLRIVVPFPAGGTTDILPRILAEKLRAYYPGGVLVDNRPGAGGNIGAEQVYRSAPDGATLLMAPPGPLVINQFLYVKPGYDAQQWVPLTVLATIPNVIAVRPQFPAKNLQEFIVYVRANPGKVNFASQGNGSTSHLTASLFMSLTQTNMVHVPYKGTPPALADLMGDQVDCFFDNIGSSAPMHAAGRLRVLAVADAHRSDVLPSVPTFVENGVAGMVAVTWVAAVAPPNTPPDVIAALHKQIGTALAAPDLVRRFTEYGATPCGWSPEQTALFFSAERAKWGQVIRAAKVVIE
jgi:tripartite-type tricarboxylate transporter receptor subunit TctC